MIEKTGSIVLTEDDIQKYNQGIVSDRIYQTWGLSLEALKDVIEQKQFTKIKDVE
jgi:hypothetical protein